MNILTFKIIQLKQRIFKSKLLSQLRLYLKIKCFVFESVLYKHIAKIPNLWNLIFYYIVYNQSINIIMIFMNTPYRIISNVPIILRVNDVVHELRYLRMPALKTITRKLMKTEDYNFCENK